MSQVEAFSGIAVCTCEAFYMRERQNGYEIESFRRKSSSSFCSEEVNGEILHVETFSLTGFGASPPLCNMPVEVHVSERDNVIYCLPLSPMGPHALQLKTNGINADTKTCCLFPAYGMILL